MRRLSIGWLVTAIVIAGFTAPALGQVGVIRGEITDPEGKPLKDVQIEIQSLGIKRTLKTKTDKNGRFLHAGVPRTGQYRVIARLEGYVPDFVEGIRPGFNMDDDERGLVNFVLKPGNSDAVMGFELTDEERAAMIKEAEEAEKKKEELASSAALFQQGLAAYDSGDYQTALDAFLKTSETRSGEPVVWANLGNTYNRLDQPEKAIEAYGKAILLDPEQHAYYQNRGGIYSAMGNAEAAQADYDKAAALSEALNPGAASINYFNMAVTHINNGAFDQALPVLTKALELDPKNAEAQYQVAICKLNLGDLEAAVVELKKYLELAPDGPHAADAKAMIEAMGGGA